MKPGADGSVSSDDTVQATPESAPTAAPDAGPSSEGGGAPVDLAALDVDTSGRYVLGATHATGGLGRVLRARDKRLHRTVAVKELLQRTPAAEARFVREALITARLEHPGIVPVHDAARRPGGEPFYSMKLVSGRTLKDLIAERTTLEARLALVPNVLAVAEAIAYAHSRDVIHRDLKPANVIVGDFGETVVIDWGLAKDLSGRVGEPEPETIDPVGATIDSGASGPGVTAAGNIMGTPSYMAPEQARGGEVDARADVYALGAILYEVLTGDAPHTGKTNEEILARAILGEHAPVLARAADVPPDLVAIVDKAMARERDQRYATAAPLADDLRRFQTGQLVSARHYSTGTLLRRWVARHRAIVGVTTAAAVALAVTGVVSFRRVVAQRNVAERERTAAERARHDAESARRDAESRSQELVFRRAETELARDPTTALAVLKAYPPAGPHGDELGGMIDQALDAGVARHVLRTSGWVLSLGWTADGHVVAHSHDGRVWRWDGETGQGGAVAQLSAPITSARRDGVSGDGRFAVKSNPDGSIEILTLDGGAKRRLLGHQAPCDRLDFSDDGKVMLSVSAADDSVRLWDPAAGTSLRAETIDDVHGAALSDDGQVFAAGTVAGEARVGRVAGGPMRTVARIPEAIFEMALSRDGRQLLLRDAAATIWHVDTATGARRELGRNLENAQLAASFSHAGDRVAVGASDGIIRLFRLGGGPVEELRGHEDAIYDLEFSPDDRVLYSSSDDGTARVWHLAIGQRRVLRGHTDDVDRIALSPDGALLATASFDGSVRIWPVAGSPDRSYETNLAAPVSVEFTRDGRYVIAASEDGGFARLDAAAGRVEPIALPRFSVPPIPSRGRDLAAFARDNRIVLWNPITRAERILPPRHATDMTALALAPDDAHLVSADDSGVTLLWDLATLTTRQLSTTDMVTVARFLPDGARFALGHPRSLELWALATATRVQDVQLPDGPPLHARELDISTDGTAVAAYSSTWLVWRLPDNRLHVLATEDPTAARSLSPTGDRVAIGSAFRKVTLWDLATDQVTDVGPHNDLVFSVDFAPDGRHLASASYDRTIRLWDLDTHRHRIFRGHTAPVRALVYSPDGRTLASLDLAGTLRLWPLTSLPDDAPAAAAARLTAATTATISTTNLATTPQP